MKKIIKLLTAVAGVSLVTPIVSTLSACSKTNDYTTMSNIVKEDAIKEFINLCPVYRPTFKTRKICDYLKARVTEFGLGGSLKEDHYRAGRTEEEKAQSSGNLTFEIPATVGYEKMEKVILQAHMDMVCKTDDPNYDWEKNGVIPVREGDIYHSDHNKTTLGADDGIGLGMILSLTKHRNEYRHGPIRVIITADEEDGKSGASEVGRDWLDGAYLVNLDGEDAKQLTTSCGGTLEARFEHEFEAENISTKSNLNQYVISVKGLSGGHSGLKIGDNRLNAIVLMVDMMNYIYNAPFGANDIYLIDAYSPGSFTSIASEINFTFATTASGDVVADYLEPFEKYMKFMHPIETGLKISGYKLDGSQGKEKKQHALNQKDTRCVIEYISLLPQGPLYYNPDTGDIETSCNIGGTSKAKAGSDETCFCLENLNVDGQPIQKLTFGIQGRSSIPEHLGPNPAGTIADYGFFFYFVNATKHVFIDPKPEGEKPDISKFMKSTDTSWLPPWPYKYTNLWNILIAGSTQNRHPLTPKGVLAWAETAYFAYHQPNLHIACIGCDLKNVHEPEEILYINTVQPVAYNLLYLFDNLPKPLTGGK